MDTPQLFKSMFRGQAPLDGYGAVTWSLPTDDAPGAWMPNVAPLVPFKSGYHLHLATDLVRAQLEGDRRVWLAEGRGESLGGHRYFIYLYESARLVRELNWTIVTRLRVAIATAREALEQLGSVEPCLHAALAEAEQLEAPTVEALREIEVRLLQPTFPKRLHRWEEEIEDDPVLRVTRRAASDRYLCVSWAIAASPPSVKSYGASVISERVRVQDFYANYSARVLAALFATP